MPLRVWPLLTARGVQIVHGTWPAALQKSFDSARVRRIHGPTDEL